MITVTKRFNFCYGHRLPDYDGKCCKNHGHNADLEVTVKGPPNYDFLGTIRRYPTMVEDFTDLKAVVKAEVVDQLDHKDLTDFFDPNPPTAEIMALWIWKVLSVPYQKNLVKIKLSEGPNSWVTVTNGNETRAIIYKYFKDTNSHENT